MKIFNFLFTIILTIPLFATEIKEENLTVSSGKIIFKSEAPQETIKGIGKQISGQVHFKDKNVKLSIDLTDWKTNSRIQTSHLHENYLETDKFPKAEFEGKISSYDVKTGTASIIGSINLHGVTKKDFTINGKVTATNSGYAFVTNFSINLKDFSIEVPKLLILKVSEIVKLEVKLDLIPAK